MNEQKALQILEGVGGVIVNSHIVCTSGEHSTTYVNKDAVYPHTRQTSKLCRAMAEHFTNANVEVVVAPAMGGIILSQWTAFHLSEIMNRDVLAAYAERDEASVFKITDEVHPMFRVYNALNYLYPHIVASKALESGDETVIRRPGFILKRGYDKLVKGKRVLIVEDVITTGGSAKKVIEATRSMSGNVVGLAAICNRGGITPQDVSSPPTLHALVNIRLDSWTEEECRRSGPCSRGIPINTAVGKGKDYLARQKG